MTNPTDLAAALNECMPLTIDGLQFRSCEQHPETLNITFHGPRGYSITRDELTVIGILWAECVRRGWSFMALHYANKTIITVGPPNVSADGTDALAFARAFAAAKKAEGGGA